MMPFYGRNTVATGSPPLFEEIFSEFIARQRALLIGHTADLRMLHLLEVEPDQFQTERIDGAELAQAHDPGAHVGNPAR